MTENHKKIVLVGFMGTGKSTVAQLLSEKLGFPRVDVDEQIVCEEGRAIAEIFEKSGESRFREIESRVLESVLKAPSGAIIATGGGAVLAERNREAMKAFGWVVALKADAEQIIERVRRDKARPLLAGDVEHRVRTLLEQRKNAYDFADLVLDTTRLSPAETTDAVIRAWESGMK